MRLATNLAVLWSLTRLLHTASASSHGHVFLLDSTASLSASHHETIDPLSARLIFAERLGLSQFYEIEDGDEEVIRRINAFGGSKQRLLGSDSSTTTPTRVFILVDGVEKPLDLIPTSPHISFFDIDPAPHPSQGQQLVSELLSNNGRIISPAVINTPVEWALKAIAALHGDNLFSRGHERTIVHVRSLAEVRATFGDKSLEYEEHLDSLRVGFEGLARLASEEMLVATVVLMPLEHHCSKQSKNHYNVKRAQPAAKMRRQESEEPLEVTSNETTSPSQTTASFSPAQATGTLPLGPIPTCFATESDCVKGTNNCTGHGVCSLKYNLTTENGMPNNCFGCICSADVITNPDGSQRTTRFGGGACQKKDIVAPFWLLTGTTIFFISIISFAVGLLYTMGNAELPSVIGAGVSGPRPK